MFMPRWPPYTCIAPSYHWIPPPSKALTICIYVIVLPVPYHFYCDRSNWQKNLRGSYRPHYLGFRPTQTLFFSLQCAWSSPDSPLCSASIVQLFAWQVPVSKTERYGQIRKRTVLRPVHRPADESGNETIRSFKGWFASFPFLRLIASFPGSPTTPWRWGSARGQCYGGGDGGVQRRRFIFVQTAKDLIDVCTQQLIFYCLVRAQSTEVAWGRFANLI